MAFPLMHALWLFGLAIPSGWTAETVEFVTLNYHRAEQVIPLLVSGQNSAQSINRVRKAPAARSIRSKAASRTSAVFLFASTRRVSVDSLLAVG